MANIHYFVDTTGCLNDWGVALAGAIDVNIRNNCDTDYTLIIPSKLADQSIIAMTPLALFKYLNQDKLKVHFIDTTDPVKSSHLITALVVDRLRQITIDCSADSKNLPPKEHTFCILTTKKANYSVDILNSVAYALGYRNVRFSVDLVRSSETDK
ncbi:MAG: hypothetical protein NC114_06345 [Ruminococcus flavefaciens]|nr:hypothetical protein [Ruminococcus flavefaciens]